MLKLPGLRDVRGTALLTRPDPVRHLLEEGPGVRDTFLVELDLRAEEVGVTGQDRLAALAEELALSLLGRVLAKGRPECGEAGPVLPAGLSRGSLLEESVDRTIGHPTAPTSGTTTHQVAEEVLRGLPVVPGRVRVELVSDETFDEGGEVADAVEVLGVAEVRVRGERSGHGEEEGERANEHERSNAPDGRSLREPRRQKISRPQSRTKDKQSRSTGIRDVTAPFAVNGVHPLSCRNE